jgi:hypothetical protein
MEVYNSFSAGQSKTQKIQVLIDYCNRKIQLEKLLDLVKNENPIQFDTNKPYLEEVENNTKSVKMHNEFTIKRIADIKRNLEMQYKLLSEYEANYILESDPKTKQRNKNEIDELKLTINSSENELNKLQNQ